MFRRVSVPCVRSSSLCSAGFRALRSSSLCSAGSPCPACVRPHYVPQGLRALRASSLCFVLCCRVSCPLRPHYVPQGPPLLRALVSNVPQGLMPCVRSLSAGSPCPACVLTMFRGSPCPQILLCSAIFPVPCVRASSLCSAGFPCPACVLTMFRRVPVPCVRGLDYVPQGLRALRALYYVPQNPCRLRPPMFRRIPYVLPCACVGLFRRVLALRAFRFGRARRSPKPFPNSVLMRKS